MKSSTSSTFNTQAAEMIKAVNNHQCLFVLISSFSALCPKVGLAPSWTLL
ncbi:hypothetical protein CSC12_3025 [Klebsiella michiganensis]|nr:hypothetical protein CSC12_3025 [Klebsiella michiganensis]